MPIEVTHFSDCGSRRKVNEDSYCVRVAQTGQGMVALLAVCDGMGGLQCGEFASGSVIRALSEWFDRCAVQLMESGLTAQKVADAFNELICHQHEQLLNYAASHQLSIGTTVSALLLTRDRYYLLQVGDCRIYLDCQGQSCLLTQDQTLAMWEYQAGNLTAEQFARDPRRSILLQCVGNQKVNPVFQLGDMPNSGAFLICSDGFYHALSIPALHDILNADGGRNGLQQAILSHAAFARTCGETDNMTAVALRWDGFSVSTESTKPLMLDTDSSSSADILVKITYSALDTIL